MTNEKVNLAAKLAQFHDHWRPRTVAAFNGHDVMVVRVEGEFVWHKHDDTDDFFLVLEGQLEVRLRDRTVSLGPGEPFVVPRGVEHQPYAEKEVKLLLIEPAGTPNTGDPRTAAPRQEGCAEIKARGQLQCWREQPGPGLLHSSEPASLDSSSKFFHLTAWVQAALAGRLPLHSVSPRSPEGTACDPMPITPWGRPRTRRRCPGAEAGCRM